MSFGVNANTRVEALELEVSRLTSRLHDDNQQSRRELSDLRAVVESKNRMIEELTHRVWMTYDKVVALETLCNQYAARLLNLENTCVSYCDCQLRCQHSQCILLVTE